MYVCIYVYIYMNIYIYICIYIYIYMCSHRSNDKSRLSSGCTWASATIWISKKCSRFRTTASQFRTQLNKTKCCVFLIVNTSTPCHVNVCWGVPKPPRRGGLVRGGTPVHDRQPIRGFWLGFHSRAEYESYYMTPQPPNLDVLWNNMYARNKVFGLPVVKLIQQFDGHGNTGGYWFKPKAHIPFSE